MLTHGIPPAFRGGERHRISSEFYHVTQTRTDGVHCRESTGTGPVVLKVVPVGHTYSKSMDQPGKVANPARGQLDGGNKYFPVRVRAREFGLARRVRPSRPASACSSLYSGCYLRDSSRVPRRHPFIYLNPSYAIGSVPSLSGQAIAYRRWRSLPRVRRYRASKPQGSCERVLPWQVTMDQ